jgi:hypothetical protein
MATEKLARVSIECELGNETRFRFLGTLADGSAQVLATGAGGQNIPLFRKLLAALAEAYPAADAITVEVQNGRIVGVLKANA